MQQGIQGQGSIHGELMFFSRHKASITFFTQVMEAVPRLVDPPRPTCKLVMDWTGPDHFVWTFDADIQCMALPRMQIGEADIKFIKWAARFNGLPFAAEAVDGDFLPIALMSDIPMLCVLRLECCSQTPGRTFEWVDIDQVRVGLRNKIGELIQAPHDWEMRCIIALIALTGTDFSRNIPMVGPKRVWFMLPSIINGVLASFKDGVLDPNVALDRIIAPLYRNLYAAHVGMAMSFDGVMGAISNSKLKSKDKMPSRNRCIATIRNANFILKYWRAEEVDCMAGHGFRLEGIEMMWDD